MPYLNTKSQMIKICASAKRVFYSKQIFHPDGKNVQMNSDRFKTFSNRYFLAFSMYLSSDLSNVLRVILQVNISWVA